MLIFNLNNMSIDNIKPTNTIIMDIIAFITVLLDLPP